MSAIDLHMHSDFSLDGTYPPGELAKLCSENGISVAALADHNSVRGVPEMAEAAAQYGIYVIPAVELDCTLNGRELHLLGYGIDITDLRYLENEKNILEQKRSEGRRMMEIFCGLGLQLDTAKVEELARDGIIVGEMIAEAALQDDRNLDNPLLRPYRPGGKRSDNPYVNFFWDFCSQGKTAFFPTVYLSFEQAADLIRATGGIAVIAHPAVTIGRDANAIAYMADCGVKGIEVYSSYHTPEDKRYYSMAAEKYGLIKTMGSDYHGKTKPSVLLGGTGGEAEEETLLNCLYELGVMEGTVGRK